MVFIGIVVVWAVRPAALISLVAIMIVPLSVPLAGRPEDVARASFSFCLPGFRESLRRRFFVGATAMGLAISVPLLWLALPLHQRQELTGYVDVADTGLRVVGIFFIGMTIGLMTMGSLRLALSRLAWSILMLMAIPLVPAAVVLFVVFIEHPLIGIPSCLALCVFVWFRLGDMRQVKRGHRAIVEDALEQRAQVGVTKTASPQVDSLFHGLMAHRRRFDTIRYIWGSLYRAFGMVFSRWVRMIVLAVVCVVVLGYAPEWLVRAAFMGVGLAAARLHLPVTFDGLWLPVGRRERCYATMATAVVASLLLLVAAVVLTVLSWLFSPLMPDFFGGDLHYAPIDVRMIGLPPLLVAWVFAVRLFSYRFTFVDTMTGWLVVAVVILFFLFGGREWLEWIDGAAAIRILAAGWASFLLALRYTYTTGPLAEAGPLATPAAK